MSVLDTNDRVLVNVSLVNKIAKHISSALGVESSINGFTLTNVGHRQGCCAYIIRIELIWNNQHEQLPKSVIVKIPTNDHVAPLFEHLKQESPEEYAKRIDELQTPLSHQIECDFYNFFQSIPHLPIPKLYLTKPMVSDKSGFIVMEDFSDVGRTPADLNLEQVFEVMDSLSSLHAHCITNKTWLSNFQTLRREEYRIWPGQMREMAETLVTLCPNHFLDLFPKLDWCFDQDFQYNYVFNSHEHLNFPPVLVHGDFHSNNLIFNKLSDGAAGNKLLAMIDWTDAHVGNFAEDIIQLLLSNCCTSDFRQTQTNTVLKYYYSRLSEKLGYSPFSFQTVLDAFDVVFSYVLDYHLYGLGILAQTSTDKPMLEKICLETVKIIEQVEKTKCWYHKFKNNGL